MRVIIKPAGLICILGAFGLLTGVAFLRGGSSSDKGAPTSARSAGKTGGAAAAAAAASAAAAGSKTPASASPSPTAHPFADMPRSTVRLPKGVLLMPDIASPQWKMLLSNGGEAEHKVVDADVPGHPKARQIKAKTLGANFWDIQLAHPLEAAFEKGKKIRLSYWARSTDSCPMTTVVEQSAAPYAKIVVKDEKLTPEWKQYSEEWEQASDTEPGWAKMDFQVSHKAGEVEITGVSIRVVD